MAQIAPDILSPQLHNFVFILVLFMLFFWFINTLLRLRSVMDLKVAMQTRSVSASFPFFCASSLLLALHLLSAFVHALAAEHCPFSLLRLLLSLYDLERIVH